MAVEFPRMLFRLVEDGKPLDFEDPKNTLTVYSLPELEKALDDGWLVHPLHESEKGVASHQTQIAEIRAEFPKPDGLMEKIKKAFHPDKTSDAADREDDRAEERAFERSSDRAASKSRKK